MEIRTRVVLCAFAGAVLVTPLSCGKAPTEPTPRVPTASTSASGEQGSDDVAAQDRFSDMVWRVKDRCPDQKGIQFRLFDKSSERAVFPEEGVFRVRAGRAATRGIHCRTGHKICLGASTLPKSSQSWGVGIGGGSSCVGCCRFCSPKQVEMELTCARGFAGEEGGFSFADGPGVDSE